MGISYTGAIRLPAGGFKIAKATVPDAFVNETILLMHADGSFTDSSSYGHTVTNALTTFTTGRYDQAFDFSGTSFTIDATDNWIMGSGDFTIECSFRQTAKGNVDTLISDWGANYSWQICIPTNGNYGFTADTLSFFYRPNGGSQTELNVPFTPVLDTWYDIAVVRSGSVLKFFVDGIQNGDDQNIGAIELTPSSGPIAFGGGQGGSETIFAPTYFYGQMEEIRITKAARYTTNYTPSLPFS